MPCVSVRHIFAERTRHKSARLAAKKLKLANKVTKSATIKASQANISELEQQPRLSVKKDGFYAKIQAKISKFTAKFTIQAPKITKTTPKPVTPPAKIVRRPRTSRITEETIHIHHERISRLPADHSKRAIYSTKRKFFAAKLTEKIPREVIPHAFVPVGGSLETRADMINAESRLGSMLFGPIPAGHRREFFHDRQNVWIWHEAWTDTSAHSHQMTIRYEVRPSGVYKKVSAGSYLKLEGSELENFRRATHAYLRVIKTYIYNRPRTLAV